MAAQDELYVHADEWANRNLVQVKIRVGTYAEEARNVGMLVMTVPFWRRFSRALEAGGIDFHRGNCQHGCGHTSHLGDSCTAGVWTREGLASICPCVDRRP